MSQVGCFWDVRVDAAEACFFVGTYCAYVVVCANWEVRTTSLKNADAFFFVELMCQCLHSVSGH